jgi:hypothetical protein
MSTLELIKTKTNEFDVKEIINAIEKREYENLTDRHKITLSGIKYMVDGMLQNEFRDSKTRTMKNGEYVGACRCVGTLVFDLPPKITGLASKKYNRLSGPERKTQGTGDHIVPRNSGGNIIITEFATGRITTTKALWDFIWKKKLVHTFKVLKTENTKLKNSGAYTDWQVGYLEQGIIVERFHDLRGRWLKLVA